MRSRFSSLYLASVALALAGCPVGAPQVGGANITCTKDSDCLAGEVCDPKYGLCIAGPGVDGGADAGPTVCVINGQTYDAGAVNPSQACQSCQPGQSATAFSNSTGFAPDGGCGQAGQVCDNGSCQTGCIIPNGVGYEPAGALEANNPCHVCDPAVLTSDWVSLTAAIDGGCGAGEVCNAGACASGCLIADAGFVAAGHAPGANPCEQCNPAVSVTSYDATFTGLSADGGCGAGKVCQGGACQSGCYVANSFEAPGAGDGSDGCQSCEPTLSVASWTSADAGTACSDNGGHFCQAGLCADVCDIGGALFNNGATNPANGCQSCQTANDPTDWSSIGGAVACTTAGGNYCIGGSCAASCDVAGTVVASAAPNQANSCQSCQPAVSPTAFSSIPDGTACDAGGGTFCASGSCVAECLVADAGLVASGALDPLDPNRCCVPLADSTGWTAGFTVEGTALATGTSPQGIAVGDLNGDGKQDLVVANYLDGTIAIFLGQGSGTFATQQTVTVGSGPQAAALADFNGDQLLDIAVVNSGASTVSVLLNQGDGGFAPAPSSPFAVGPSPTAIAVGNFKTKTSVDIAVTDLGVAGASGNEVSILLNDGTGSFGPKQGYQVGTAPSSVAMADYDNDGFGDLAVANQSDGTVTVLTDNGNGTFTTQATLTLGGSAEPNAVVATDLNGDGKPDLAVANNVTNDIRVFLNLGGSWSSMQGPFAVGTNPMSLVAGNFNGNGVVGLNDLAVANKTTGTVSVLLNKLTTTGSQTAAFWPQDTYGLSAGLVSLAGGLFNADTLPDLAVVDSTQKSVSILLGNCP